MILALILTVLWSALVIAGCREAMQNAKCKMQNPFSRTAS